MTSLLLQDLGLGVRLISRRKAFASIAILTLALGVGANTAVFSIVNALLLHPYDVPDPDRLVLVRAAGPRVMSEFRIAPADFADLQREVGAVQRAAAFRFREANLTVNGETAEPILGYQVSPNFFDVIGVVPARGRGFASDDAQAGGGRAAIISDALWRHRFDSDPALVGKSIELDGRAVTVVGVMPAGFEYPPATDLWMPLALGADEAAQRDPDQPGRPTYQVLARLQPDADAGSARAQLDALSTRLARQFPESHRDRSLRTVRLRDEQAGFSGPPFLTLQAAAAFILILATANLLNLFFVRAVERERELAARIALGANRRRIAQALIGEIVPLLAVAVLAAVVCAQYGVIAIRDSIPADYTKWIAGWSRIRVDGNVLALSLALGAAVAAVIVTFTAWKSSRVPVAASLKEGGRDSAPGARSGRTLAALVVLQLVFATALLTCTGLLIDGFMRLSDLYARLDASHVVGMRISLPERDYADDSAVRAFYGQLLQDVAAQPGIESVGAITNPPASNVDSPRAALVTETNQGLTADERDSADVQAVGGDIFGALHLPVQQGRGFAPSDDERAAPVALISRTLAARSWPGDSAIGKRIRLGEASNEAPWVTIVGIVDDVKQNWWDSVPRPVVYTPYLQTPKRVMELEVRSARDPLQLVPAIRESVRRLSPSAALVSAQPLQASIADSLAPLRILRTLMSLFGALATILAAIGVFGILAHSVARRMHEFGVRSALGARRADLLRLVFAQNVRFCVLGICLGLPVAFLASTALRNALPGFIGFDAPSFLGLALLVTLAAFAAGLSPALRAMRVDPSETLRGS